MNTGSNNTIEENGKPSDEKKIPNGIMALPACERPYEKCIDKGEQALTDTELIAVILRTGGQGTSSIDLAREILTMPDGSINVLALQKKSLQALLKHKGIGRAKAAALKCIAEVARRTSKANYTKCCDFESPGAIAAYYSSEMRHLDTEQVRLICLNGSNRFLGDCVLSSGIVNQALISTREVFIKALDYGAVYIILLHNHPGGNPLPSKCDLMITEKVAQAGKLMDIGLLDHIIIGDTGFVSLKDSGYIDSF